MNILVIDSLPLFAAGVSNVLNALDAHGVFIDTHYCAPIGPACKEAEPSAVVMEWNAQDDGARQRLSELRAMLPEVPILLTVQAIGRHVVGDALRFGAAGVVDRQATADVLLEALQRITSGAVYLPPISNLALDDAGQRIGESPTEVWQRLTPRQHEVLQLLAEANPTSRSAACSTWPRAPSRTTCMRCSADRGEQPHRSGALAIALQGGHGAPATVHDVTPPTAPPRGHPRQSGSPQDAPFGVATINVPLP